MKIDDYEVFKQKDYQSEMEVTTGRLLMIVISWVAIASLFIGMFFFNLK